MNEISAEVVIRQSLRSLVHELAMGVLASREESGKKPLFQKQTENLLRSPNFLKALYESPTDNIGKILLPEDSKCGETNNVEYTKEQRGTIVAYLQELNKLKSPAVRDWNTLRHYLYYVYRQFVTPEPNYVPDAIPSAVIKEIRDLVEGLVMEDTTQLFLRLFAQVREFVTLAVQLFLTSWTDLEHEEPKNGAEPLYFLMYQFVLSALKNYYSALCAAAEVLSPVLPELEELLTKEYSISWSFFNKSLFFHYFYGNASVQAMLLLFEKVYQNGEKECEQYLMYMNIKEEMQLLQSNWEATVRRIIVEKECLMKNNPVLREKSNKMLEEHRKILRTNFWMTRTLDQKLIQEREELGAQVILWVGDKDNLADRLLNLKGQCICEECMLVEYGHISPGCKNGKIALKINKKNWDSMMSGQPVEIKNDSNSMTCNTNFKNQLDYFEMKPVDVSSSYDNFDNELNGKIEPVIKIASEPPAFNDLDEVLNIFSKSNADNFKACEDILSTQTLNALLKPNDLIDFDLDKLNLNADEDIFKNKIKSSLTCRRSSADDLTKELAELNITSPETSSKTSLNNKINTICSTICKNGEPKERTEEKKICSNGCDHHKESKKCDCTYCEVFGTSVSIHSHKTNETRDRLRTRLNQRKEKYNGSLSRPASKSSLCSPYPNGNIKPTASKVLSNTQKLNPFAVPKKIDPLPTPTQSELTSITPRRPPSPKTAPPKLPDSPSLQRSSSVLSASSSSVNSYLQEKSASYEPSIDDLLNYIEGKKKGGKIALAEKKAAKKARQQILAALAEKKTAKKARQRMKKEEERLRLEEEERRKAEEERIQEELRKEEERRRAEALAKQLADKLKKSKKKELAKKKKKQKENKLANEESSHLFEETIPAMVTIKRVVENNNCTPTVTITLKGSTPDQDKLLYTLVNGYNDKQPSTSNSKPESNKKKNKNSEVTNEKSSKKNQKKTVVQETSKELKVLLAVDKSSSKPEVNKQKADDKKTKAKNKKEEQKKQVEKATKSSNKEPDLNLPMLRLPPGITITKVDGPLANKNSKVGNTVPVTQQSASVPVSKSGVIVVDTEKLIQQSVEREKNKKKRKKNKRGDIRQDPKEKKTGAGSTPSMVTLKNPIFHTLQTTLASKVNEKLVPDIGAIPCSQQASIIKNENGMVTIRSPRLQQSLANGTSIPNYISDLKPVIGPDVSTPYLQTCHTNFSENSRISSLNAQEILSGLPGIEITKVDKHASKSEDSKKSCQAADVSIIPTSNGVTCGDKFAFDRDDWHYESVFTPKDILEDDLDAEERELEAFKRFCQQSVPPKCKEKVAHLNVKDIILKKKNDVTYV